MKIKLSIAVDKSFEDEITVLQKTYEDGDIAEFMKVESDYLEKLLDITKKYGNSGISFQVSFAVKVEVE